MNLDRIRIHVCTHALHRWRERAALYADDGAEVIAAAVRQARLVGKKEFIPINRRPKNLYFQDGSIYFVAEWTEVGDLRIITVIGAGKFDQYQLPKIKLPEPKDAPAAPVPVHPPTPKSDEFDPDSTPPPLEVRPASFESLEAEGKWLSKRRTKLTRWLCKVTRKNPWLEESLAERQRLDGLLRENSRRVEKEKRQREQEQVGEAECA